MSALRSQAQRRQPTIADKPILNLAYDYAPVGTQKSLTEEEEQYHNARLIRAGGVVSAYSEQDLIDKINRYLEHPELEREGRQRIAQQECQPFDGKSAERIAQFILDIADKSNTT